jgi:hypothetical protein
VLQVHFYVKRPGEALGPIRHVSTIDQAPPAQNYAGVPGTVRRNPRRSGDGISA